MARRRRGERKISPKETRKYQLRERKERRERQMLLAVLGPVLVFVLIVIGYGAYSELYVKPRTPVARVEGENITAEQYATRVQWLRPQLVNEIGNLMSFASSDDGGFLQNYVEGRITSLPEDARSQLVDDVLIRQEAEKRGIEVTEEDIDARIREDLENIIAPPEPETQVEATIDVGSIESSVSVSATEEITATPTTIPTEEIGEAYNRYVLGGALQRAGLTENEYREQVVRPQVYRTKLQEALADEIPEVGKQVEAANLRFASEETAQRAADALAAGETWEDVLERFGPPEEDEQDEQAAAEDEAEPGADVQPEDEAATEDEAEVVDEAEAEAEAEAEDEATIAAGEAVLEEMAATGEITLTGEVTPVEGLTDTAEITATAVARPTPSAVPTPTPEPFAFGFDEAAWVTLDGLRDDWSLTEEDAQEVMALEPTSCAGPFKVGGGTWYVVCVFDSEESRPLDQEELDQRRETALEDWLEDRRLEASVDKFPLDALVPPEPDWYTAAMEEYRQPQPTIDLSSLQMSTAPADEAAPAEATSPAEAPPPDGDMGETESGAGPAEGAAPPSEEGAGSE